MNEPLTWSELGELYDKRNPSGAAKTLPMNRVFQWAQRQPDIELQDDGTLILVMRESEETPLMAISCPICRQINGKHKMDCQALGYSEQFTRYIAELQEKVERLDQNHQALEAENVRLRLALRDTEDNAYDPDYIYRIVEAALEGGDE